MILRMGIDIAVRAPHQASLADERGELLWSGHRFSTTAADFAALYPADLTRQINQIELRLIELSRDKTEAMTASRHLDMASLEPSIRRLQTTK